MGEPQQLTCRICGDSYYLHPASEKPVADADLCPTCETFQLGLAKFYEEPVPTEKDRVTLGILISVLSAVCILLLLIWAVWSSLR